MTAVATPEVATSGQAFSSETTKATISRLRPPSLETLFTVLFALAGWYIGLRRLSDNSFLWHWRTGHLILEHGVPHADPFSFTVPGANWIAQSWLAELAYAVADKLAGAFGIRVLLAATGAALGACLYRITLRFARDRLRAALVTLAAMAAVLVVWSERPLIFGLLAMAAVVWMVEVPDSFAGRHATVLLPAVLWLWANVHGTFELGYVYLGLHLVGQWSEGAPFWQGRERRLTIAATVALVLIAVNPYGISLLLFPFELVRRGDVLGQVAEWNSPNFRRLNGMMFGVWLTFVVTMLARRNASRRDVIVAVPFLLLALWAVRNVGLATIVTLPIVARLAAAPRPRNSERSRVGYVFLAGLLALGLVWTTTAASEKGFELNHYPVKAAQRLEAEHLLGKRLFTTDAWAGYLIAKYWPDQHVFLDDRYDMYPKRVVDDYNTIADVEPAWSRTLDRWGIDVVVWSPKRSLSQALAERTEWERVYADKTAVVFVRRSARV
jgi:hypothetical protein